MKNIYGYGLIGGSLFFTGLVITGCGQPSENNASGSDDIYNELQRTASNKISPNSEASQRNVEIVVFNNNSEKYIQVTDFNQDGRVDDNDIEVACGTHDDGIEAAYFEYHNAESDQVVDTNFISTIDSDAAAWLLRADGSCKG